MKKLFSRAVVASFLAGAVLFSSCQNFMNGGLVKGELENEINYAKAQSYTLFVETDSEQGSFLSAGEKKCKVGYSFDLQFTVKKGSCIFRTLEAVSSSDKKTDRSDCVEIKVTDSDEANGVYKINVKLVKAASDILIRPVCVVMPYVIEIQPAFNEQGCDQDRTVVIVFNKAMDPATFDLSSIKMQSGSENLSSYYETPYFSSDNKTINIPTVKGNPILASEGTKDISVNYDFTGAMDAEGLELNVKGSYQYRVNAHQDDVAPVFENIRLWRDESKSVELTGKDFDSWSSDEYEGFENGDYSRNHLQNSFYFEITGSDEGSGIKTLVVTEKLIEASNGLPCSDSEFLNSVNVEEKDGVLSGVYNFVGGTDGVIELEFSVEDGSRNVSAENKTFYTIRDTKVIEPELIFEEFSVREDTTADVSAETFAFNCNNRTADGAVTFTISPEDIKSYFYRKYDGYNYTEPSTDAVMQISCDEACSLDVFWGDSENSATAKLEKTEEAGKIKYSFKRDVRKTAFLKFVLRDDFENETVIFRTLLPMPDFDESSVEKSSSYNCIEKIVPYDSGYESIYYFIELFEHADDSLPKYRYISKAFPSQSQLYAGSWNSDRDEYEHVIDPDGYVYKIRIAAAKAYEGSDWVSTLSEKCLVFTCDRSASYRVRDIHVTLYDGSISDSVSGYINSFVNADYEALKGSGTCKVTLSGYVPDGLDSTNVKYAFRCERYEDGDFKYYLEQDSPVFYLPSPGRYKFYIEAKVGNVLYASPYPLKINGADGSSELNLSEHLMPLVYIEYKEYSAVEAVCWLNTDHYYESGCYYFIPDGGNGKYTLEQLESLYSSYSRTDCSLTEGTVILSIPFDSLSDGDYTLCIALTDTYGNTSVTCFPVYYKFLNADIKYSDYNTNDKQIYTDDGRISVEIDKWNRLGGFSGSKKAFYNTSYIYIDNDWNINSTPCNSKNIIDGRGGSQIYCDAPVLVHTMYSTKKLTSGTRASDAKVWLTRGREAGHVEYKPTGSESFTYSYSADDDSNVPYGSYYVTIVHFADGTVIMGDIKRK